MNAAVFFDVLGNIFSHDVMVTQNGTNKLLHLVGLALSKIRFGEPELGFTIWVNSINYCQIVSVTLKNDSYSFFIG